MPNLPPPGIIVKELSLHFEGALVFDRLSFTIEGGQFVVLLGPSGIGKTSLLKIIAGLLRFDSGSVAGSDGQPIHNRLAYMGQQDLLYPWLSVIKNITLGARLRHEPIDQQRACALLDKVGLFHAKNQLPHELSGGMRQRAALARTLYENRPIVLMDEPFSALDAVTRLNMHELASELLSQKTVLLITHDPLEAARLGHSLMVLRGKPAQLSAPIRVAGKPPRSLENEDLLHSQAQLMRLLKEA